MTRPTLSPNSVGYRIRNVGHTLLSYALMLVSGVFTAWGVNGLINLAQFPHTSPVTLVMAMVLSTIILMIVGTLYLLTFLSIRHQSSRKEKTRAVRKAR